MEVNRPRFSTGHVQDCTLSMDEDLVTARSHSTRTSSNSLRLIPFLIFQPSKKSIPWYPRANIVPLFSLESKAKVGFVRFCRLDHCQICNKQPFTYYLDINEDRFGCIKKAIAVLDCVWCDNNFLKYCNFSIIVVRINVISFLHCKLWQTCNVTAIYNTLLMWSEFVLSTVGIEFMIIKSWAERGIL